LSANKKQKTLGSDAKSGFEKVSLQYLLIIPVMLILTYNCQRKLLVILVSNLKKRVSNKQEL